MLGAHPVHRLGAVSSPTPGGTPASNSAGTPAANSAGTPAANAGGTPANNSGSTPASSADEPWPIRLVSMKIGQWIARLGQVWVEGQVTQLTRRGGSNAVFATLRDVSADISIPVSSRRDVFDACVPPITEGSRVIVRAKPDFYIARGSLSLRAEEFRAVGIGELLARLERLKRALAAEGLFAASRKRPLPFLPHGVGLITGRASAAERDVVTNATNRWPSVRFHLRPVPVQGAGAAGQIIEALRELEANTEVDVIVLARGGGSVEDLLPFSDEGLLREVADCRTPIISAIGHEQDSPLLDLVADVRCSTPTDAGKRIVPDLAEEVRRITDAKARAERAVRARITAGQDWLDGITARPVLARPTVMVDRRADDVRALSDRAERVVRQMVASAREDISHLRARVVALSPASTLARGYAVVQRADGELVRDPAQAPAGTRLRLRLAGGDLPATADVLPEPDPNPNP